MFLERTKEEKEREKEKRRRLSVVSLGSLGLRGRRTHAHLAGKGGFRAEAMVAAGLFGNSPVSGTLGPVTQ